MGGHSDADITNMRRVIGKRLQASKMEVPHYYLTLDIEMDKVWPLTSNPIDFHFDKSTFIMEDNNLFCSF